MPYLAPSILSANFGEMANAIKICRESGLRYVHADVMDGNFVPNITFGQKMVADLREPAGGILISVHLMIDMPERYVGQFCEAGGDLISVHAEATNHIHGCVQTIRNAGKKAGIALNPATPISIIEPIIDDLDFVLIMTVNPGFGGQKLIKSGLRKIEQARSIIESNGRSGDMLIEVDGGVKLDNIQSVIDAGADIIVAGSAVFGTDNPADAITEFSNIIDK